MLFCAAALSVTWLPRPASAQATTCSVAPTSDAAFDQARVALDVGDHRQALRLADMVSDSELADIVRWASYADEASPATFDDLSALIRRRANWPNLGTLRLRAEKLMPQRMSAASVADWFDGASPQTFDGLISYMDALRALNRTGDLNAVAKDYWHDYPMRADQQSAFLRAGGEFLDQNDHWRRADRLVWRDSFDQARRVARLLGDDRRALIDARITLRTSRSGVDAAVARVPAHLQNDEGLLYDRMRWRQRRGLASGTLEMLDRQPQDVANKRSWWRVRMVLARDALEDGQVERAYRLASEHRQTGGVAFVGSEWLAGWIALSHLGRPGPAAQHFARLYEGSSTPISRSRGAYWLGEAWQAMGDREKAAAWWQVAAQYPTAFYGQLADQRLGRMTPIVPAEAAPVAPIAGAHFADRGCLVLTLARLGATDLAQPFVDRLFSQATTEPDFRALAGLSLAIGDMPTAVNAGKRLIGLGTWLPAAAYPRVSMPEFAGAPETAISLAIIRQESSFDTNAVSSAGARGLMQLMPGTARDLARKLGLSISTGDLNTDAETNLRLGSEYLKQMLDRYDGSVVLALAAYNAGPGNANRWINRFGDPRDPNTDVRHWIESIPFSETRNYVQRVLEATIVYRRLAGHEGGNADLTTLLVAGHPD